MFCTRLRLPCPCPCRTQRSVYTSCSNAPLPASCHLSPSLIASDQFAYDNGLGSPVDRFQIDLYKAIGTGDCGDWVTSICDKPGIGCKDSSETKLEIANTAVGLFLHS